MPTLMKEIEDIEIDEAVSLDNLEYGRRRTYKQWMWEYRGNCPLLSVFTVIKDEDRIVARGQLNKSSGLQVMLQTFTIA